MIHIDSEIVVSNSIHDIFTYLNSPGNHARFIPNMIHFNQTSLGAFGRVGAKANGILNILGVNIKISYELIEHEPDRRLAMKGSLGPLLFKDGYVLEIVGNKTKIKFWLEIDVRGVLILFQSLTSLIAKLHARETLQNLRRELEHIPN